MKIGIITAVDWKKGLPIGGASSVIRSLLPYIYGDAYLLGIEIMNGASDKNSIIQQNCSIITIYKTRYPSRIPQRAKALLGYWRNKKRIEKLNLDLLYIHTPETALPFVTGKKIAPVVFHQHGSFNPVENTDYKWARNRFFKLIFRLIYKKVYKKSDAVIAIDKLCFMRASENGAAHKTSLITNPIDTRLFNIDIRSRKEMRKKYQIKDNQKILIFAGRLSRKKRIDVIIDTIYGARNLGYKWVALIAGSGALEEHLKKKVELLELSDHVKFLGKISYYELPKLYNAADVVVLPSIDEGIPMMLLEGLACGTPVVATRVGGIPEFVNHGVNGILINEATAESLLEGLKYCFNKQWNRQIVRGSIEQFSGRSTALKLCEIFESIVQKRNGQKALKLI